MIIPYQKQPKAIPAPMTITHQASAAVAQAAGAVAAAQVAAAVSPVAVEVLEVEVAVAAGNLFPVNIHS